MKEKERLRRDIGEAFDFVRFLVKNPKELRKVKGGSEIRIVPAVSETKFYSSAKMKNVQAFAAETVYHPL